MSVMAASNVHVHMHAVPLCVPALICCGHAVHFWQPHHRYVVCEESRQLALLARLLRRELEALGDDPTHPARAMVFAQTPEVSCCCCHMFIVVVSAALCCACVAGCVAIGAVKVEVEHGSI